MSSWGTWLTDQVADATGVDVSGVVAGVSDVSEQLSGAIASVSGDLQEFVDTVQVRVCPLFLLRIPLTSPHLFFHAHPPYGLIHRRMYHAQHSSMPRVLHTPSPPLSPSLSRQTPRRQSPRFRVQSKKELHPTKALRYRQSRVPWTAL